VNTDRTEIRRADPAEPDPARLVARCQLGEAEAFDELVATWHEPLWRYVRRTAGDAAMAEDVLQDGWLRILRGIGGLRDATRLRPWLFAIVRRALMDRLRVRYTHDAHAPLDVDPVDDREPEPFAADDLTRLDAAMAALPPADREVTALFYLQGLDLREVAQIQDIPVGTVKSRLHRARRLLRERLEAPGASR
jgi:RNA polymerase sigma factor (sigma-70 family)